MRFNISYALVFSLLLSSCSDSIEKECYEATKAVVETTEKSELTKNDSSNAFWRQAMFKAVSWRAKACKVTN
jgi:hypothetical protein